MKLFLDQLFRRGKTHAEEPADRNKSAWKGPVAIPADFKREAIRAFEPICDIANSLDHVASTLQPSVQEPSTSMTACQRVTTRRLVDAIFWGNWVYNNRPRLSEVSNLETVTDDDFQRMLKYGPRLILCARDILTHNMISHMRDLNDCTKELAALEWTKLPDSLSDSEKKGREFAMMMGLFAEALIKFRLEAQHIQEKKWNPVTILYTVFEAVGLKNKDKMRLDPAIVEWANKFAKTPDCGTNSVLGGTCLLGLENIGD
jgi:hypothetical protein